MVVLQVYINLQLYIDEDGFYFFVKNVYDSYAKEHSYRIVFLFYSVNVDITRSDMSLALE